MRGYEDTSVFFLDPELRIESEFRYGAFLELITGFNVSIGRFYNVWELFDEVFQYLSNFNTIIKLIYDIGDPFNIRDVDISIQGFPRIRRETAVDLRSRYLF